MTVRHRIELVAHDERWPADDECRLEAEVWLAFTVRSLVVPVLRALGAEAYDVSR